MSPDPEPSFPQEQEPYGEMDRLPPDLCAAYSAAARCISGADMVRRSLLGDSDSVLEALFLAARLRAFYLEGVTAVKQVSRALTATRNGQADFLGIKRRNAHLVALDVARDVFGLVRPELHDASLEPESLRRHANWGNPKTWFSDPQAARRTLLEKLQPLDLSGLENEIQHASESRLRGTYKTGA